MASPAVGDVHVSKPLTNLAIHYQIPDLIAPRVFPKIPVEKEFDKYYTFKNYEELIAYHTLRAAGDPANEMDFTPSTETYECEEHALKMPLPKRVVAVADAPTQIEKNTVKKIVTALLIGYERRVQALAQATASVGTNFAVGTAWNTAAGAGTVESDIQLAKRYVSQACGVYPNAILMSRAVADWVLVWLKIKGRKKRNLGRWAVESIMSAQVVHRFMKEGVRYLRPILSLTDRGDTVPSNLVAPALMASTMPPLLGLSASTMVYASPTVRE